MVEHSKDELLHVRETFRHGHVVIVFVLSVAFRRRRHLVLGGVLIAVADWGQFVDVGVFLIYLTWVAATGTWVAATGFGHIHEFCGRFLGWYSKGSSGRLLGVLGSSLEFGRAPVLVKSSQKLKIGPIF